MDNCVVRTGIAQGGGVPNPTWRWIGCFARTANASYHGKDVSVLLYKYFTLFSGKTVRNITCSLDRVRHHPRGPGSNTIINSSFMKRANSLLETDSASPTPKARPEIPVEVARPVLWQCSGSTPKPKPASGKVLILVYRLCGLVVLRQRQISY